MFGKIKDFLKGESNLLITTEGKPTDRDVMTATAVLLLEAAGSDSDYAPEETSTIFSVIEKQFRVSNDEALELLESADALRQDGAKIDEFVTAINQHFEPKQKEKIFAMVWTVILADGRVDKHEMRIATQLRNRLQLSEEQYESAKKLAESRKLA